jgi:DnaA-homolog protein
MQQLTLGLHQPPAPSFDNFVPAGNLEAFSHLQAFLASPATERSFCLSGAASTGKTHLLQSAEAVLRARGVSIQSVTERADFQNVDFLLIDTVALSEAQGAALFTWYNAHPTSKVILAQREPILASPIREDTKTRLALGQLYSLAALPEQAVLAAIDNETLRRGFLLSKEVVAYLFNHWQRDLRSLLMVISELDEFSMAQHRPITVPLLKSMLQH